MIRSIRTARRMSRSVVLLTMGLALPALAGLQPALAQTSLPETQVTASPIPDYEFDWGRKGKYCASCNFGTGNARFTFSDAQNRLWLGYVDYNTGAFYPTDGHGVLIDTNVAKATDYGNGPEWVASTGNSQIVYTKYAAGVPPSDASASIAIASMVNGSWSPKIFSNGAGKASPAGTLDNQDAAPRINYVSTDKTKFYMRSLNSPDVEVTLPLSDLTDGNARRWVDGTRKIIFQGHLASAPRLVDQAFLYDTDSGQLEQLTNETKGVVGVAMWKAPEFNNEYVFFTMTKGRQQLVVYRKLKGADGVSRWTAIKSITAPAAVPYFWSPEYFVHNGRSYIFTQVSPSSKFYDLGIPTHIAITGIDPLKSNFKMLTNDTTKPRVRLDPEYFITAKGPYIYYTRLIPEHTDANGQVVDAANDGVWRVDPGLGAPLP